MNFGFHSDWIRELIDLKIDVLADFCETFKALVDIDGIGAFRAVHITTWVSFEMADKI